MRGKAEFSATCAADSRVTVAAGSTATGQSVQRDGSATTKLSLPSPAERRQPGPTCARIGANAGPIPQPGQQPAGGG